MCDLKTRLLMLLIIPNLAFSKQEFYGDIRGTPSHITVSSVGGHTAANIAHAVQTIKASTSDGTPGALVMRDSSGEFVASKIRLTGTPTDDSHIVTKTYVDTALNDNLNSIGGSPSITRNYYVSKAGSDDNDGSFRSPFLTLKAAIEAANLADSASPIVIEVGTGMFIEDNSTGPITITANALNIIGESINGTVIKPLSLSQDLFSVVVPAIEFANLTLDAGADGSTASAVRLVTNSAGTSRFESILVARFYVGLSLNSSAGLPISMLNHTQFRGNGTGVAIDSMRALVKNAAYLGSFNGVDVENAGISITGDSALVTVLTNSFRLMDVGILVTNGGDLRVLGTNFESSNYGIRCESASVSTIVGCNFVINNSNTINCFATGAGTVSTITGCNYSCKDSAGVSRGIGVAVTGGAATHMGSCVVENAAMGLLCGASGDTSSTQLLANSVSLSNNINDVTQLGLSTVRFIAGIADATKLSIANNTNVSFNSFDDIFTIGSGGDTRQVLFQILNGNEILPNIIYHPSYYGNKGLVYQNDNADQVVIATQAQSNHAYNYLVTGDNQKEVGINLISDTTPFGNSNNVRGWEITKTGTNANLAMSYINDDADGQAERGSNIVMQLNGFANQVEFPMASNLPLPDNIAAKLVWAGDTNLYRSSAGTLQTDGNFQANTVTADLIGDVTGSASLNVLKTGDTMTGALTLPAGSANVPSLNFVGNATTGISAATANKLSFDTNGVERMSINNTEITSAARFVFLNVFSNQATQFVVPTNGGATTANDNTAILILKNTSNVSGYTINFPPSPVDGQFFMILLGTSNNVTGIVNTTTDGSSIINGVTSLTPTDLIITDGGASVSYFYSAAANTWYRCHRG